MKKIKIKKSHVHQNQKSFFFEDYFQSTLNQKKNQKIQISEDRLYILFVVFFSLIAIFSISIISTSIQKSSFEYRKKV